MLKTFKTFTEEREKELVTVFGRFNPPTIGHEKLFDAAARIAKGKTLKIYASQSEDPKKNPLGYEEKIKFLRKMFPTYGRNIILDRNIKNVFNVASDAYDDGYTKFSLVAGSDRVSEFKNLLMKYNNVKGAHGFYYFKNGIEVYSAGERDPDSDDVSGMSASKMRKAAAANNIEEFSRGLPRGFSDFKKLFNAVRVGMGLSESVCFRKHTQFKPVSEARELYIRGEIFNVGDKVYAKSQSDKVFKIVERHTNYVTAVCENQTQKFFIDAISPVNIEENSYYTGLSKSTIVKRKKHFEKNAKKDDNDDSAYKPAPGDATAKTKPSQYTLKYKQMFGEEKSAVEKSIAKKSEESGIAYSILKDVYDRGYAAWRTGHRPGTTPEQWGLARVNSFIVGGKTQKTADADLWKKVNNK